MNHRPTKTRPAFFVPSLTRDEANYQVDVFCRNEFVARCPISTLKFFGIKIEAMKRIHAELSNNTDVTEAHLNDVFKTVYTISNCQR